MSTRAGSGGEFESLRIEGGLFAPEWLSRVAALKAKQQTPADYGVPRGLLLRDEISRYWRIAQALWTEFEAGQESSDRLAVSRRFVHDMLVQVFGFVSLAGDASHEIAGRTYSITFEGKGDRVPVVVAPGDESLDTPHSRHGDGGRRRSAFGLLQEYLNAADEALWGLACNGLALRLARDNASLTRPAWLEADLERIFGEDRFADFSVLWLFIHASRFGSEGTPVHEAPLEDWRNEGQEEGTRAREALRVGVEQALRELGQGFLAHPGNSALRQRLEGGELSTAKFFNQLLRLVYRLIFLLTVEERGLLHPPDSKAEAKKLYVEGYSLRRLRERCLRRSQYDRHPDLWNALKPVFTGLGHGEPRLALPALGGLFAEGQCPDLNSCNMENHALLSAIFHLTWMRREGTLTRVNWKDMGSEELGSVYESLLELTPLIVDSGHRFSFAEHGETRGHERKVTGSYYTPDLLVQQLLDSALEPVVQQRIATHPDDPEEAILEMSVIDPACGSGHFLLAAARRLAGHLARLRSGGTPTDPDYRHALRDVVSHCIYGIDRNAVTLELARMALWLEAFTPDRPLGFLDHHLVCGDALLGLFSFDLLHTGIPDEAFKALEGCSKELCRELRQSNRDARRTLERAVREPMLDFQANELGKAFAELDATGDATLSEVVAKMHLYDSLHHRVVSGDLALAADIYTAAFLIPKTEETKGKVPTTADLVHLLHGNGQVADKIGTSARRICNESHVLHWPLAFPQVLSRGGFDVVLGNPPWDTQSPDAKEFFSAYDPAVRFLAPEEQERLIADLLRKPAIEEMWSSYRWHLYASVNFLKNGNRYRLFAPGNLGKGDFNVYRMFVELALDATREYGFASQIAPENLYNGANATAIRKRIFSEFSLTKLLCFENTRHVWFQSVHTSAKFCLYAARKGGQTLAFPSALHITSEPSLQHIGHSPGLRIPVALIREFSPKAVAVMEFDSQFDIDICSKMYSRFPKFGTPASGAPHRVYMREIDMGNDRALFTQDAGGVPVFEGRMVSGYDYRAKSYVSGHGRSAVWEDLEFGNPQKAIRPQWYIPHSQIPAKVKSRLSKFRIGFCDVASPSNERSLVASLIPPSCLCGHKVPTIFFRPESPSFMLLWLGIANSMTMDFLVRKKVSLTMSYTIMDSLPFPRPNAGTRTPLEISRRVLSLSCAGDEMTGFISTAAPTLGLEEPDVTILEIPDERDRAKAEIEVLVARELYGLTHDELRYILDPSDLMGEACQAETFRVLKKNELRRYGEYRTRRLVLEAWDRLFEPANTPD